MLEPLRPSTGRHELELLLALHREDDETASLWTQRIEGDRECLLNQFLPDPLYWGLMSRYLLDEELKSMINARKPSRVTGSPETVSVANHKTLSVVTTKNHLSSLVWSDVLDLVKNHVGEEIVYKENIHKELVQIRRFTLEQARAYFKIHGYNADGLLRGRCNKIVRVGNVT